MLPQIEGFTAMRTPILGFLRETRVCLKEITADLALDLTAFLSVVEIQVIRGS